MKTLTVALATLIAVGLSGCGSDKHDSPEWKQAKDTAEYYCIGSGYDQYSDEFARCVEDQTPRFYKEDQ